MFAVALATATALALTACSSGAPAEDGASDADAVVEIGSLYEPGNLSNVDAGGQGVTEALGGNVYEGGGIRGRCFGRVGCSCWPAELHCGKWWCRAVVAWREA